MIVSRRRAVTRGFMGIKIGRFFLSVSPGNQLKQPAGWKKLMNWITWHFTKPGKQEATVAMDSFLNAIRFENCILDKDVRQIILNRAR